MRQATRLPEATICYLLYILMLLKRALNMLFVSFYAWDSASK